MMSSTTLCSLPSSKSKRSSASSQLSTNSRICPGCRNPVIPTRASQNARPGLALPTCACSPNKPNPSLAEDFAGRIQMRRKREKVRVYEPYPGAKESDIYAETLKTGTATSPLPMRAGVWKEGERKEVGAQHVEDVGDEGHGNDAEFEDVNLAEEEVTKVAGAEEQQEEEEEGGDHQASYGAESREERYDDLMDDGFVIVEKYEWMVAEEVLSGVQTSPAPGYWKLARAVLLQPNLLNPNARKVSHKNTCRRLE